jgi:hypothetical protein
MLTKLQEDTSHAKLLAQVKISIRRATEAQRSARSRYWCRRIAAFSMLICSLASLDSIRAQEPNRSVLEPVRSSTSRSEYIGFRPPTQTPLISFGPFQGSAAVSLGFDYTDNANLNSTSNDNGNGKESRFRIIESLDLDLGWVISSLNRVSIRIGGSLSQDLLGNEGNQQNLSLAPDSEIRLQLQISNLRLQVYDQFSYVNDPVSDASTSNQTNLNRFTNIGGVRADWDLNFTIFSVFLDDTYSTDSGSGNANGNSNGNRNSYRLGSSFTFNLTPTILYGIEGTATYSEGTLNDGTDGEVKSLNVGPFVRAHLTRLIDLDLAAGVSFIQAKDVPPVGYYVAATVRHQINRNWQYFLTFTHDTAFSSGIDISEENFLELGTQYQLTRFIGLTGGPFLTYGKNQNGLQSQRGNFSQYGVDVRLGYSLNKHTSVSVGYRYVRRTSDVPEDSYLQNTVNFQISYVF